MISVAVKKQLSDMQKSKEANEEVEQDFASLVQALVAKATSPAITATAASTAASTQPTFAANPAIMIKSILKRVQK